VTRFRDLVGLGLAFQLLLLGTVGMTFSAIGVLVDPAMALTSWYDLYFPIAMTVLAIGLGLAWWALSRWPWIAPGGVWNVALLAFGGALVGMAAGGVVDVSTGGPPTPELPSIVRAIGWGVGLVIGLVLGQGRGWLVRDEDTMR
jgi:hypothetical protein